MQPTKHTNQSDSILPPAVNFHLWKPCNLRCTFCYAHFDDDDQLRATRGGLSEASALRILDLLRTAGAEKLTLVGGEPTLCPHLPAVLRRARDLGFVSTLVTNGARLDRLLDTHADCLDWVGLSVDSGDEAMQQELGRVKGDHVGNSIAHAERLHALGIRVKLNTVVTALNWREDMAALVRAIAPERWKVFQVLPVEGQNDGAVERLLITPEQFASFTDRHRHMAGPSLTVAFETNENMTGSYAMVDPLGRFFSNVGGRHTYSPPILDVGVTKAFDAVAFDAARFEARGGRYDWGGTRAFLTISAGR